MMRYLSLAFLLLVSGAARLDAAVLDVGPGCAYTTVQSALNAASALNNDVVWLKTGAMFDTENVSLPYKTGADATHQVYVRSGLISCGVYEPESSYPAAGVRVCPSTVTIDWMNCSVLPGSQDMSKYATIKALNNNFYAVRTAATGTGPPVSYYNFSRVVFAANAYAGNSLIGILNDTAPMTTGSAAMTPDHITFDQCVFQGDPVRGQFRGMQLDGRNISVTNSFMFDIKAQGEGQGIWINGPGPVKIWNNYVNCGTECFFTGGSGTQPSPSYTVQASPVPTSTTLTVDRTTDLYAEKNVVVWEAQKTVSTVSLSNPAVFTTSTAHGYSTGQQIVWSGGAGCTSVWFAVPYTVTVLTSTTFSIAQNCTTSGSGGTVKIRAAAEIVSIVGSLLTVTPALPFAPVSGDLITSSLVTNGMDIRYNVFTRPANHRTTPIIPTPPTGATATGSATGGTLGAGTYKYRVEAYLYTAQYSTAFSGAAAETSGATTTGTTSKVTVAWTAVPNAVAYRIYGRTPAGQDRYWDVNAPAVTFDDVGTVGTLSAVNTYANLWQVKNVFEIKEGINVTAQYNLIENSWQAGQGGPCVLFTATQQQAEAISAVVRDVVFQNNVIRHCAQMVQFTGRDAVSPGHESARSGRVSLINNLFYDIGQPYGNNNGIIVSAGGAPRQYPKRSVFDFLLNHNTMHFAAAGYPGSTMLFSNCEDFPPGLTPSNESPSDNTDITNNILYNGTYYGLASISNASANCGTGFNNHRVGIAPAGPLGAGSAIATNVLAGATCSDYTTQSTNMLCPSVATLESTTFANTTTIGGFQVLPTSAYYHAGTDGNDIGADISLILPGTNIAESGDNSGGLPPPAFAQGAGPIIIQGACRVYAGAGTPEGAITAPICSLYLRSDGSTSTVLYVKESGTGNTGWVTVGAGGGGGLGYTLRYDNNQTPTSPADSTIYLFGQGADGYGGYSSGNWNRGRIRVPKAGTIKAVTWDIMSDGTAASSENVSHYLRLNDTTDTTLSTTVNWSLGTPAGSFSGSTTGLSIAVVEGDYVMFKILTPAWATNPTFVNIRGYIYIE